MKVAIVGGGLAGCAAAYVLAENGHEVVLYEAGDHLASEASGNSVGLYNPRFGAEWSPQSQYYAYAFESALEVFSQLDDIDFDPCGALHLMHDEKKQRRFPKTVASWPWGEDMMRIVGPQEASEIARVEISHDCLFLPRSGSVNPRKLCYAYTRHPNVDVRLNVSILSVDDLKADAVVLAAGRAMQAFDCLRDLDLRAVRGQVSYIKSNALSEQIQCHLCYGGYASRAIEGRHVVGATFQRWLDHSERIEADNSDNLGKLYDHIPSFPKGLECVEDWVGVRCTSKDHFPVVGALEDGVYVTTAHGSHGVLSSLAAANVLVGMMTGQDQSFADEVIYALSPARLKG
ncbi:MAG: FAD-dependent 5-carboxymethylaminomethyl-2-thiouridine(34) oxidoreductase MnmC [Bdellovibrionales bacterium]